jgi:sulfate-transporting ATPase
MHWRRPRRSGGREGQKRSGHDRWFLDRIATHNLAFEGESQVVWYEGNYREYEADKKRRLGSAADIPHRIKYKRLVRA